MQYHKAIILLLDQVEPKLDLLAQMATEDVEEIVQGFL
jgi:hypothetical protein